MLVMGMIIKKFITEDSMFKLINGIYYSEHTLDLEHNIILQSVLDSKYYPKDSKHKSRPNGNEVEPQHTFYEDTNLYDSTYELLGSTVGKVVDGVFGQGKMVCEDIWGHIIPPMEQTMIHKHGDTMDQDPGVSWVYYPHFPKNAGELNFISNVGGKNHLYKTSPSTGKLFIFSKYILHFTPRNSSDIARVSISGNFRANNGYKFQLESGDLPNDPYWQYTGKH